MGFIIGDVARNVSTNKMHIVRILCLALIVGDVARNVSTGETPMVKNVKMAEISPKANTLATVIRGLKSAISKFAHENDIPFAWQTRFHDRIIRNQEELNATAKYIEDNLIKWPDEEDEGK